MVLSRELLCRSVYVPAARVEQQGFCRFPCKRDLRGRESVRQNSPVARRLKPTRAAPGLLQGLGIIPPMASIPAIFISTVVSSS